MNDDRPLMPSEAEAVIEDRIEQFGLVALPQLSVTELPDGNWLVRWDHLESTVPPMCAEDWEAWLVEHVGSLDAGDLETRES